MRTPLLAALSSVLFLSACGDKEPEERKMPESFPVLETTPPEPSAPLPPAAMVMVELIEVEFEDFSEWSLSHEMSPTAASGLRLEVQRWLKNERAVSLGSMVVNCKNGSTAKTSSVREFRYPAKFAQESVASEPEKKEKEKEKGKEKEKEKEKGKGKVKGKADGDDEKTKKKAPASEKTVIKTNPSPVAFDFREAGISLEVSIQSMDPKSGLIELSVNPELVKYIETIRWKAAPGNDLGEFESPSFDANSIKTDITVQSGYFSLLGMSKIPEGMKSVTTNDGLLLAFIRADSNQPKTK